MNGRMLRLMFQALTIFLQRKVVLTLSPLSSESILDYGLYCLSVAAERAVSLSRVSLEILPAASVLLSRRWL